LESGISFNEYRAQNPTLAEESPQVQAQVAQQFFNSQMNKQPGWQEEAPQVKEQVWQSFKQKYNLPDIPLQAPAKAQAPQGPQFQIPQQVQDFGHGLAASIGSNALDQAYGLKGASIGYLDLTKPIQGFVNQENQAAHLQADPFANVRHGIFEFGGGAAPFILTDGALSGLGGAGMLGQMLRSGTAMGLTAGLHSNPGNQLDLGKRAQEAAMGFAGGALLPPLETAGSAILKGGVKAVRNIFQPNEIPIRLPDDGLAQRLSEQARQKLETTVTSTPVYNIRVKATAEKLAQLKEQNPSPIVQRLVDKHEKILADHLNGVKRVSPKQLEITNSFIDRAPRVGMGKKPLPKALQMQAKATKAAPQPPVSQVPETVESPPKQKAVKLSGTVKEMVSHAEQAAGLPEGAGNLTAGQLEKQMGQPLSQEQKDAHANLREVAKTEPDPDKPIARQMPVNEEKQLLHGEVKDAIPAEKQPVAEKINTALESGKKIKWEVAAERSGRSNEAAHVTATGNVKITPTEFTPTHWSKSNNGEVFIHGYNQRGHVTMHPIEDVHKVLKTDAGNGFQGTTPNRVLGQRDYLVSDVLNRGPRSESGAIKTSEQIRLLSELKDIYKPENFNKFPKPVRDRLNKIRKKGRIDQLDMTLLVKDLQNNKENLEEFCKIVGIHG